MTFIAISCLNFMYLTFLLHLINKIMNPIYNRYKRLKYKNESRKTEGKEVKVLRYL